MMLKISEVAERLNVSESLVYALVEAGRLSCHSIGVGRGTIRVSTEDLDAFLATCRDEKAERSRPPARPRLRHIKI